MPDPQFEIQCAGLLEQHSQAAEGFIYPDWDAIYKWAADNLPPDRIEPFYDVIVPQWLKRLQPLLGREYRVSESDWFLLLSAEGPAEDERLLSIADKSLKDIYRFLGDIADYDSYGKSVILRMHDPDIFWRYISHFFPGSKTQTALGVFIPAGYSHIVLAPPTWGNPAPALFHELIHQSLGHLDLPCWLGEGLAQFAEAAAGYIRHFEFDDDLAQQHWDWWDEENIQKFWSGGSFHRPDQRSVLSYQLALILIRLILSDLEPSREDFAQFVLNASPGDAGNQSAIEHLGADLGQVAAIFLGEGNWAPQAERWNR